MGTTTAIALAAATLSILPTVWTLKFALAQLRRLYLIKRDGILPLLVRDDTHPEVLRLIARQNATTELLRLTKHAAAVFGIAAWALAAWLPWAPQDVRDVCLAFICAMLGATSVKSLVGMKKLHAALERNR